MAEIISLRYFPVNDKHPIFSKKPEQVQSDLKSLGLEVKVDMEVTGQEDGTHDVGYLISSTMFNATVRRSIGNIFFTEREYIIRLTASDGNSNRYVNAVCDVLGITRWAFRYV